MSEPMPTFATNRDRLTYLLAEYKIPLTITLLAAGVWAAYVRPELPTPPDSVVAASISATILTLPLYVVGQRIARYLYPGPDWVFVGVADPGTADSSTEKTGEYDVKKVRPEVWAERTETTHSAMRPAEGVCDFVVTGWNWMEELGELEVRGCDQEHLTPAEAWQSADRVDEIHEYLSVVKRKYTVLKGRIHRISTDIHDVSLMAEMAEKEKSELAPEVSIRSKIEEMENEVDDLPEGPSRDGLTYDQERMGVGGTVEGVDAAMDKLRPDMTEIEVTDGGEDE